MLEPGTYVHRKSFFAFIYACSQITPENSDIKLCFPASFFE